MSDINPYSPSSVPSRIIGASADIFKWFRFCFIALGAFPAGFAGAIWVYSSYHGVFYIFEPCTSTLTILWAVVAYFLYRERYSAVWFALCLVAILWILALSEVSVLLLLWTDTQRNKVSSYLPIAYCGGAMVLAAVVAVIGFITLRRSSHQQADHADTVYGRR